ncbi:MAG: hypothetical protein ACLUE7_05530 [Lachnospirales bacterium]
MLQKAISIFFLDSGEGRELFTDNLEGEDLSGWLIPKSQAEEFENLWKQKGDLTKWNDFVCFAVWEKEDDDIKIYFRKY